MSSGLALHEGFEGALSEYMVILRGIIRTRVTPAIARPDLSLFACCSYLPLVVHRIFTCILSRYVSSALVDGFVSCRSVVEWVGNGIEVRESDKGSLSHCRRVSVCHVLIVELSTVVFSLLPRSKSRALLALYQGQNIYLAMKNWTNGSSHTVKADQKYRHNSSRWPVPSSSVCFCCKY